MNSRKEDGKQGAFIARFECADMNIGTVAAGI